MTHTFCETRHSKHREMNNYRVGSLHVLWRLTKGSLVEARNVARSSIDGSSCQKPRAVQYLVKREE